MQHRWESGLGALVFAFLATAAGATHPNLLANGDFDASTSGWSVDAPRMTWETADVDGHPHSGSARLVLAPDGPIGPAGGSLEVTASPCIELQPGDRLSVTGSVWVDQVGAGDRVGIGFALFQDLDCDPFAAGWAPYVWWADPTAKGWQTGGRTVNGDVWGPRGVKVLLMLRDDDPGTQISAYFDGLELHQGACEPTAANGQEASGLRNLCLNDDRFQVSAAWKTPNGNEGHGVPVPFSADSGSFWFFSPSNLELDVKILDGCGFNGRYWVFAAGLTNAEVTLTVFDTVTGESASYSNPLGRTFVTITDTDAFDTCP